MSRKKGKVREQILDFLNENETATFTEIKEYIVQESDKPLSNRVLSYNLKNLRDDRMIDKNENEEWQLSEMAKHIQRVEERLNKIYDSEIEIETTNEKLIIRKGKEKSEVNFGHMDILEDFYSFFGDVENV